MIMFVSVNNIVLIVLSIVKSLNFKVINLTTDISKSIYEQQLFGAMLDICFAGFSDGIDCIIMARTFCCESFGMPGLTGVDCCKS